MSPSEFYCPRCYSSRWRFPDPLLSLIELGGTNYLSGQVYLECRDCKNVWNPMSVLTNNPPMNPEAG